MRDNLKQASLAMLGHEERYKFFPSGGWGWQWVGVSRPGIKRTPGPAVRFYDILPLSNRQDIHSTFGSDRNPDSMAAAKIAACTQRIQTPLTGMNCPSRRPAVPFPIGGGADEAFSNANAVQHGRPHRLCGFTGDLSDDQWSGGPARLPWAATFSWPPS